MSSQEELVQQLQMVLSQNQQLLNPLQQVEKAYSNLQVELASLKKLSPSPSPSARHSRMKLPEPPTFSGKDPKLWSFQLHSYFSYLRKDSGMKMTSFLHPKLWFVRLRPIKHDLTVLLLRGKAATWYRTYILSHNPPSSYEIFMDLLMAQFGYGCDPKGKR